MADEFLGTDLSLALLHSELRPVYTVATEERSVGSGRARRRLTDFARVAGRDNLAQAILLRLLTPRGELSALGHPEYGSRLHEVIGRTNTETTRHLVRLYVLESLKQEPRIAEVLEVAVAPSPGSRDRVEVLLRVLPLRDRVPVDLGPFTLEL